MPTSDYHQISDVLHVVEQCAPRRVLDVGVGFGKWGFLCREILEVYHRRLHRSEWTTVIDGIEIHEPYRNPAWDLAYDQIHIGDVTKVLPELPNYDLIICCDVIEHLTKAAGFELIGHMLNHGRHVLLTSPCGFHPQGGGDWNNEYESHHSGWTSDDFDRYPHLYKQVGFTFLAVLASKTGDLSSIELIDPLKSLGAKRAVRAAMGIAMSRARKRLQLLR